MLKNPNCIPKIQEFSLILAILMYKCNSIGQNDQNHVLNKSHNHTDSKYFNLANVAGLISKLATIGTFWPFLAAFGIESVTRLMEIFFRHLISVKTIKGSTKC